MARIRLALWGVVLLLVACGNLTFGPNLDDAVRDMPAAEIRGKIAGHQGWDQRLSRHETRPAGGVPGHLRGER